MKVALAQINPIVGDLDGNRRKILAGIERAEKAGADLVVFPELAVTGYPPKDLLDRSSFVDANLESLNEVAGRVRDTAAVVGFVDRDRAGRLPSLCNAAALLHRGKVLSIHHKSLLPTYDVFDEVRYFSPALKVSPAAFGKMRLGVSVCEDAWNDQSFWSTRRYTADPIAELVSAGAEALINISASPYVFGKRDLRTRMLSELAEKHRRFLVYVNQVGGNDELVFDGNSTVFAPDGSVVAALKGFAEDFAVVDLDAAPAPIALPPEDISSMYDALVLGTRDYILKTGFSKAVIGLSGGIDSALTACIAADALGREFVRGLNMPSRYSSHHSIEDAEALAKALGIRFDVVSIEGVFGAYLAALAPVFEGRAPDIAEENVQARIRGALLMAISNKFGNLVMATGNKSELSTGYCTLYGDMCGSLAPIGDVPKMKVYELARYVNRRGEIIPERTFTKPPSAELKPDQTDQDTLPPYPVLDDILKAYVEESRDTPEIVALGFDEATVRKVIRMVQHSEYKRKQAAPVIKVTTKAFGIGRRMPIVQRWQ
jgi:NAD+ synthetase